MKRSLITIATVMALVAAGSAEAKRKRPRSSGYSAAAFSLFGPRCKRGKPCGNACIARDRVCHK